ncbi:MAG: hypothetical protein ACLFRY_14665 [Spirochaetia bacterium]
MTHKEILRLLDDSDIPGVVIGGTALRLYGSPRVTHDIDVAVPILEIDTLVNLMYAKNYYLVVLVNEKTCTVIPGPDEALDWIEREKVGSVSFIEIASPPGNREIPHEKIDVTTQADFLFEPGIPFPRLIERAQKVELDSFSFLVASPEDLLFMKENRKDKTEADRTDIEFLKKLIAEG